MNIIDDINTLTEKIVNPTSKSLFEEALRCRDTGIYRASIVLLWSTFFFDVMWKLKELGSKGDNGARNFYEDYQKNIEENDTRNLLKKESDIIETCINHCIIVEQNKEYLERLKSDRNKCAHITINENNEYYKPQISTINYHLDNLSTLVLHKPARRGKKASDEVCKTIISSNHSDEVYFRKIILQDFYRNDIEYIEVLTKRMAREFIKEVKKGDGSNIQKYILVLKIIYSEHPTITGDIIRDSINSAFNGCDDKITCKNIILTHIHFDRNNNPPLLSDINKEKINLFIRDTLKTKHPEDSFGQEYLYEDLSNSIDLVIELSRFSSDHKKVVEVYLSKHVIRPSTYKMLTSSGGFDFIPNPEQDSETPEFDEEDIPFS